MEHQADNKTRNLTVHMKWCPQYVKWQTQISLCPSKRLYMKTKSLERQLWLATSGKKNRRETDKVTWFRLYYLKLLESNLHIIALYLLFIFNSVYFPSPATEGETTVIIQC